MNRNPFSRISALLIRDQHRESDVSFLLCSIFAGTLSGWLLVATVSVVLGTALGVIATFLYYFMWRTPEA